MFLDFEKLPIVVMVERYEVWVILGHVYWLFAEFHAIYSVLNDTQEQVLYCHQLFCLVFQTKQFFLPILLFQFLNQHDRLCIHVLLTTVLIAQDVY